jgi:hypothetical protein
MSTEYVSHVFERLSNGERIGTCVQEYDKLGQRSYRVWSGPQARDPVSAMVFLSPGICRAEHVKEYRNSDSEIRRLYMRAMGCRLDRFDSHDTALVFWIHIHICVRSRPVEAHAGPQCSMASTALISSLTLMELSCFEAPNPSRTSCVN